MTIDRSAAIDTLEGILWVKVIDYLANVSEVYV